MMMLRVVHRSTVPAVVALITALLVLPHHAVAQTVSQAPDGTVAVEAAGAPLGDLLARLGTSGSFRKLVVDPQVAGRPVTITLERVTVRQAVVQILNAADVNYALTADDDGRSMRLIAGEVKFVADTQRVMAREAGALTGKLQLPSGETTRADIDGAKTADAASAVVDAGAAQPSDSAADAFQLQQLHEVLTTPVVRPPVGSVVDLPFPGPDGRPLTTVVQPPGSVVTLPFPTTTQAPPPQATPVTPQVPDAQTLELLKALMPQAQPQPVKR